MHVPEGLKAGQGGGSKIEGLLGSPLFGVGMGLLSAAYDDENPYKAALAGLEGARQQQQNASARGYDEALRNQWAQMMQQQRNANMAPPSNALPMQPPSNARPMAPPSNAPVGQPAAGGFMPNNPANNIDQNLPPWMQPMSLPQSGLGNGQYTNQLSQDIGWLLATS